MTNRKSKASILIMLIGVGLYAQNLKTVTIGNQVWIAENLNVDKFRNGDPIPQAKTDEEWIDAGINKQPVWCYYKNDPANGVKYGKLYNWYAVNDSRGLAPEGWHIPTNEEWKGLIDYLGGNNIAGGKMKSTVGWNPYFNQPETATNESGLSGLPGGFRLYDGRMEDIGSECYWWSSTESLSTTAYHLTLSNIGNYVSPIDRKKEYGMSVRCTKDQ